MTLEKNFDPAQIEKRWYAHWEDKGLFRPERGDKEPFTIVNPPPNVTGSLHIGHALDNTLQDIMVRYERLRGRDALWVVGTDHAGIATQMVVERQLEAAGDKRTNYTREDFVKKVWQWKEESGGQITRQLRRLGCSMDWSREQFTMDPHFSKAVLKVFVDLYNQGLIYRDKRLVNWDPKLKTAISDLEVETREIQGHFWHFKYPLADGVTLENGADHIVVATTRPETMLADMAVAVNAADPRYTSVIGKFVELPITGRRIPIVADDHADPELGSGAVKVTPGHDFNDFEVGKRAGIAPADMLNMFDAEANVVQTADGLIPTEFVGMERWAARKAVVAKLEELSLLSAIEDRIIQTPYGDRGGVVIEPWLTDQWYVDAKTLAGPAMEAVRSGAIEVVPKSWEKTYFHWMENIQPWCVSRQLWWGHRIPAWYGFPLWGSEFEKLRPEKVGNPSSALPTFVAENDQEAIKKAEAFYRENWKLEGKNFKVIVADEAGLNIDGDNVEATIRRDSDVLDTWFSSALWPFATLGWPEETTQKPLPFRGGVGMGPGHQASPIGQAPSPSPEGEGSLVAKHYPNDLLISGFDILFFWDARMAMMGTHLMGEAPWKRLYLHGLVRAADGSKMSKSKGNTVDPLGLIDQYGADALRFFMSAMESQGRDIKMDEKRVEGYRNFATKLWNASRFCETNGIGASKTLAAPTARLAVNRWIIGAVIETQDALDKALADLRFDAAANTIYHFVWDQFCDWYLELIKPVLSPLPLGGGAGGGQDTDGQAAPTPNPSRQREGDCDAVETRAVAGWVLDQILVMLHPFMPFITEELWHAMGERQYELIVAKWPAPKAKIDTEAKAEVEWLIRLVSETRTAKNELGIPPGKRMTAFVTGANDRTLDRISANTHVIARIARLDLDMVGEKPEGASVQLVVDEATFGIPLEGVIDLDAEKSRLTKALEAVEKEAKSLEGRLNNPNFVERAKPEAVEKARADHAEKAAEAERLQVALNRLG